MAIIALKAWYLAKYEPIKEVIKKPCTLRLSRNSLLKTGLRTDFLDDRFEVESSDWFELYLGNKTVEFYIEGSGSYVVSNVDLVSQEIYFTKSNSISGLEPIIYYSPQHYYQPANKAISNILSNTITKIAERSRIPLSLEIAPNSVDSPLRFSNSQFRKINKSLLLIADVTPVEAIAREKESSLLVDPSVCLELGYGIQNKDDGQILLVKMERSDLTGVEPFDVANYRQLSFQDEKQLGKTLPTLIDTLLQRYSLF
ncbi:MAG: hypothetical protein AAGE96_12145 [Cyanobacteria bacterium P01_G01_bin.19]